MFTIANAQLFVHDQDVALRFWTEQVGMEVRADISLPEMGNFRWLTVGPVGQPEIGIVLMPFPQPPMVSAELSHGIADLTAKGGTGTVFLETDDCRKAYAELSARGVDFTQAPTDQPYGVDAGFRDPSGNNVRLTQARQFD